MSTLTLRRKRTDLEASAAPSLADELLDEILPQEIDWRQLVWSYPKASLTLAALGGYLLGRSHGRKLIARTSRMVGDTVSDGVNEFFERKVL